MASTTTAAAGSNYTQLLVFGAFFVAMYFLLVRPQRKRQAAQQTLLSALEVGVDVITIGGLHGRVDSLDEDTVDLLVDADGTVLRFQRSAVASVVTPAAADSMDSAENDGDA